MCVVLSFGSCLTVDFQDDAGDEDEWEANVMILILNQTDKNKTMTKNDATNLLKKSFFPFLFFFDSFVLIQQAQWKFIKSVRRA